MNLKLVGTGAISGVDRSACSLIDNKIMVDCGNGLIKTLIEQGVEIMNIEAIFITHLHADHFFDLPFLVLLRSISSVNNLLKIYCPVGTEKIIEHLCDDYVSGIAGSYNQWKTKGSLEFFEFENLNNEKVLETYFVTSFKVCHGNKSPAYGYVIKHENKAVGFSGDSSLCAGVEEIVKNSDVSVLDMFSLNGTHAHMSVLDIEKLCSENKTKTIVSTHCTTQAKIDAKERNIKNLIIAEDGLEIEV